MRFNLLMFFFSAILIASISMAPVFGQTDALMTIATDKSIYLESEIIVITGEVENLFTGTPVTIIVKSPNGNLVAVDQITVSAEKKFTSEIKTGSLSLIHI